MQEQAATKPSESISIFEEGTEAAGKSTPPPAPKATPKGKGGGKKRVPQPESKVETPSNGPAEKLLPALRDGETQDTILASLAKWQDDQRQYLQFQRELRRALKLKVDDLQRIAKENPANLEAQTAANNALELLRNSEQTEKTILQVMQGEQRVANELTDLTTKRVTLDAAADVNNPEAVSEIGKVDDLIVKAEEKLVAEEVKKVDEISKVVEDLKAVDPVAAEKIVGEAPDVVKVPLSQRIRGAVSSVGEAISTGYTSIKKKVSDLLSSGKPSDEVAVEIAKAPKTDAAKILEETPDLQKQVVAKSFKQAEQSGAVAKGTFGKYLKYLLGAGLVTAATYGAYRTYLELEGYDLSDLGIGGETPGAYEPTGGGSSVPSATSQYDGMAAERQAIIAAKSGDADRVSQILSQYSSSPEFRTISANVAAQGYGKKYIIMFTPPLVIPGLGSFSFVAVNDNDYSNPSVVQMSRTAAEGDIGSALSSDYVSTGITNPQENANQVFDTILAQRLGRQSGEVRTRRLLEGRGVRQRGGIEGQRREPGLTGRERRMRSQMAGMGRGAPAAPSARATRASEDVSRIDQLKKFAEFSNEISTYSEKEDKIASVSTNKKKSVDLSQFFKLADDFSKSYHKDAVSDLNDKDPFMSSYFTGLSRLYDEKPKAPEGDYESLYNLHDETGDDLIHAAHPKEVRLLDAIKDGGLVENGFEQQRASKAIAQGMPTGNYTGNYAWVKKVVKSKK
jgi:hypothetical protein